MKVANIQYREKRKEEERSHHAIQESEDEDCDCDCESEDEDNKCNVEEDYKNSFYSNRTQEEPKKSEL